MSNYWPDFLGQAGEERRRIALGEPERTPHEIHESAWNRPGGKRTAYPVVGQRVKFRREEWGRFEPATVTEVQDPGDDDPNLIKVPDDPMPWVTLQTDSGFVTRTREARVRGAAGWTL